MTLRDMWKITWLFFESNLTVSRMDSRRLRTLSISLRGHVSDAADFAAAEVVDDEVEAVAGAVAEGGVDLVAGFGADGAVLVVAVVEGDAGDLDGGSTVRGARAEAWSGRSASVRPGVTLE